MKSTKEIILNYRYACKVRGREAVVRVIEIDTSGYKRHSTVRIVCQDVDTGRQVIVRAPSRLLPLGGKIKGSDCRSSDGIAREILHDMDHDNGCRFVPCKRHWKALVRLVGECWAQGLQFYPSQISTLAYGEETAAMKLWSGYDSGPAIHRCLNAIFDGCKLCHTELALHHEEALRRAK